MSGVLRVALLVDPEIPVPPRLYGGIERVVDLLAQGLVRHGHNVTVFANPDSRTAGTLIPYKGRRSDKWLDTALNTKLVTETILGGSFDLVHSFARLAYMSLLLPLPVAKLMTYQRAVTRSSVVRGRWLSRGTLQFTAVSESLVTHLSDVCDWRIVYNGIDLSRYVPAPSVPSDAPLMFLGRIEPIKGPDVAITVARRAGRRLVIAGNVSPGYESFFENEIRPHLSHGDVIYVGAVDDVQKNELLRASAALLMPIRWDEPFGIVMAEALACGVPVIAFKRGAAREVISHAETGFVCNSVAEMIESVRILSSIDRAACRQRAELMFGEEALVRSYTEIYRSVVFNVASRGGRKL